MTCNMRHRRDDIPKVTTKEKSWWCEECNALVFSERKPLCRRVMKAKIDALHAFADAEELDRKNDP